MLQFKTISGCLLGLGLAQDRAKGMGDIWARPGPGLGQGFWEIWARPGLGQGQAFGEIWARPGPGTGPGQGQGFGIKLG